MGELGSLDSRGGEVALIVQFIPKNRPGAFTGVRWILDGFLIGGWVGGEWVKTWVRVVCGWVFKKKPGLVGCSQGKVPPGSLAVKW